MKEITIKQQKDNSFEICQSDEVIGKLILDPKHRKLADLFQKAPEMMNLLTEARDLIIEIQNETI